MPKVKKMKKGFTLIELAVAVGLLAMVLAFAGTIFNVSIETHRTAGANAEIMQKLRAVTDQLNSDFAGLQKDGYLILRSETSSNRREFEDPLSWQGDVGMAQLYYFTTGDFQSWSDPAIKSNIARAYLGHDNRSLIDNSFPISKWRLAHDVRLLVPGAIVPLPPPVVDYNDISYAACKANLLAFVAEDAGRLLTESVLIDTLSSSASNLQSLMAQNVGQIAIEWTDGSRYSDPNSGSSLVWFGISSLGVTLSCMDGDPNKAIPPNPEYGPAGMDIETVLASFYQAYWRPGIAEQYWPKALKFSFTLYDSKGILEKGRTFTHIVYLE